MKKTECIKKIVRTGVGVLVAVGFLLVVGSAGAYENEVISTGQYIVQSVIGILLFSGILLFKK